MRAKGEGVVGVGVVDMIVGRVCVSSCSPPSRAVALNIQKPDTSFLRAVSDSIGRQPISTNDGVEARAANRLTTQSGTNRMTQTEQWSGPTTRDTTNFQRIRKCEVRRTSPGGPPGGTTSQKFRSANSATGHGQEQAQNVE